MATFYADPVAAQATGPGGETYISPQSATYAQPVSQQPISQPMGHPSSQQAAPRPAHDVTNPAHVAKSDDKFNSALWIVLLIVLCIFLPFIAVVVIGAARKWRAGKLVGMVIASILLCIVGWFPGVIFAFVVWLAKI